MAIGRISGQMLKANLLRSGTDLAFETNLLVLDVTNSFVGVGTATPSRQLHISGTGAIRLPAGTTGERGTAGVGDIRYNSTLGSVEAYTSAGWVDLASGSTLQDADGNTGIAVERSADENNIHFFVEGQGDVAHIRSTGNIELNNLEIANQTITGLTTNADITLTPNGTGNVNLDADTVRVGDSGANATITTNGAADVIINTNAGSDSGSITIADGVSGDISILNNGSGKLLVSGPVSTNGATDLVLSTNQTTNSGTITIADGADGNIDITPNGTGEVNITKVDIDAGTIDGTVIGGASAAAGTFTTLTANTSLTANTIVTNDISSTDSTAIQINDGANISGTLTANTFNSSSATITGGTINNAVIGGTTAAAATFTSLTTSGGTVTLGGTTTGSINNVNIGATTEGTGKFTTLESTGNMTVGGNLTVNGTTTTVNSTTLSIEDPLLVLAKNNSGGSANIYDQGILFNRGSLSNVVFFWDESADEFVFATAAAETGATAGNITIDAYQTLRAGTVNGTSFITDGITIGTNNISATRSNDDLVLAGSGSGRIVLGSAVASTGITMTGNIALGNNDITGVDDVGTTSVTATGTVSAATLSSSGISITQNNISATRSDDDLVLSGSGTGKVVLGSAILGATSFGDNDITNVGDINVDSVSSDNGTSFALLLDDNSATALEIKEAGNAYLTFVTTNSSEQITLGKKLAAGAVEVAGSNFTITGGTINGTVIGGSTAAAGTFTTVNTNDHIVIGADGKAIKIGASGDLQIAHDGTDTTINNQTGILKIDGAATSSIKINAAAANVDTQISGDTDAELLYVDASADKIGISTNTPAYILDIASTDAVRLPSGANGTRPTAATGVIRFNTDSSAYEGSTDGSTWTTFAMGGGGVAAISKVSATGDGSTSTFTGFFASTPATAANVMVYIDNVYQEPTENYTVSSNNITFTSAPHSGARIFALVGFDAGSMTTGGVSRTQTDSVSFTSADTAIMTFNATSYRSAELFITVTDAGNTEYACMKANVVHDGTTAFISVYGIVNTGGSDTATLTATLSSGTVTVSAISTGGASSAQVQYSLQAV